MAAARNEGRAGGRLGPVRRTLFFVPHLALLLIPAVGEYYWLDWLRVFLGVLAVVPWWCRIVGRGWSLERRFVLGPGLVATGLVGLAIAVWLTSTGPDDWMVAVVILLLTLAFLAYAGFVFQARAKE
jgi:hypothetical protein